MREEVIKRGAVGNISSTTEIIHHNVSIEIGEINLSTEVIARGVAEIS